MKKGLILGLTLVAVFAFAAAPAIAEEERNATRDVEQVGQGPGADVIAFEETPSHIFLTRDEYERSLFREPLARRTAEHDVPRRQDHADGRHQGDLLGHELGRPTPATRSPGSTPGTPASAAATTPKTSTEYTGIERHRSAPTHDLPGPRRRHDRGLRRRQHVGDPRRGLQGDHRSPGPVRQRLLRGLHRPAARQRRLLRVAQRGQLRRQGRPVRVLLEARRRRRLRPGRHLRPPLAGPRGPRERHGPRARRGDDRPGQPRRLVRLARAPRTATSARGRGARRS